jgi:hypothetical protein
MSKISARGSLLKASVAKQNMMNLDDTVHSVAWSFEASEVIYMDDFGGTFRTAPATRHLTINFTDDKTFHDIVYSGYLGKCYSEFESSEVNYDDGFFFRGSSDAIINQSSRSITQLYMASTVNSQTIILSYRPFATIATIGTSDGKPLNLIRLYIINLNSSENRALTEKFYLKITSINVTTLNARQYEFNQSVSSLALESTLDGTSSVVWLPISSNQQGAIVDLEVDICYVKIMEANV